MYLIIIIVRTRVIVTIIRLCKVEEGVLYREGFPAIECWHSCRVDKGFWDLAACLQNSSEI